MDIQEVREVQFQSVTAVVVPITLLRQIFNKSMFIIKPIQFDVFGAFVWLHCHSRRSKFKFVCVFQT